MWCSVESPENPHLLISPIWTIPILVHTNNQSPLKHSPIRSVNRYWVLLSRAALESFRKLTLMEPFSTLQAPSRLETSLPVSFPLGLTLYDQIRTHYFLILVWWWISISVCLWTPYNVWSTISEILFWEFVAERPSLKCLVDDAHMEQMEWDEKYELSQCTHFYLMTRC